MLLTVAHYVLSTFLFSFDSLCALTVSQSTPQCTCCHAPVHLLARKENDVLSRTVSVRTLSILSRGASGELQWGLGKKEDNLNKHKHTSLTLERQWDFVSYPLTI